MYQLLDSGNFQKLEQFGPVRLIRPAAGAIWKPSLPQEEWKTAHALFSREKGLAWTDYRSVPKSWNISYEDFTFELKRTDFGHLGIFPEHAMQWRFMKKRLKKGAKVLNLFAYTGGATMACAASGAQVCHVDSSKPMIGWARENAQLNGLSARWIVEDARKFVARAQRRGETYDGILLDPPSFGHGKSKELFKIERDLPEFLHACASLLSQNALFFILSCHTPGLTPLALRNLLHQVCPGKIESGEMKIEGPQPLPAGSFARWSC